MCVCVSMGDNHLISFEMKAVLLLSLKEASNNSWETCLHRMRNSHLNEMSSKGIRSTDETQYFDPLEISLATQHTPILYGGHSYL